MPDNKSKIEPKSDAGHGEEVTPTRIIAPNSGWLTCPENAGKYTGENAPWRR